MTYNDCVKGWDLAHGEVVELDDAHGTELRIARGSLWVTMERDLRDIVLQKGQSFVIDRNGMTLVEAQGRTTVCVDSGQSGSLPKAPALSRWSGLWSGWLRHWFGAAASPQRFVPYL